MQTSTETSTGPCRRDPWVVDEVYSPLLTVRSSAGRVRPVSCAGGSDHPDYEKRPVDKTGGNRIGPRPPT